LERAGRVGLVDGAQVQRVFGVELQTGHRVRGAAKRAAREDAGVGDVGARVLAHEGNEVDLGRQRDEVEAVVQAYFDTLQVFRAFGVFGVPGDGEDGERRVGRLIEQAEPDR